MSHSSSFGAAGDGSSFVPKAIDIDAIRTLCNQSLGDVANQFQERQLAKPFRIPQRPDEINNYDGAGMIPCTMVDGKLHVLLNQPRRGKKAGMRWFDFGGKKKTLDELPSDCACRKFTKYTYGLFAIETDWSSEDVMDDLEEIYARKGTTWPLLLKAGTDWSKKWLLESDSVSFYDSQQNYHLFLMPVPFIAADIFTEVSALMDGNKREFQWIPHDIFSAGPLALRVQNRGLFRKMMGVEVHRIVKGWSDKQDILRPITFDVLNLSNPGDEADSATGP